MLKTKTKYYSDFLQLQPPTLVLENDLVENWNLVTDAHMAHIFSCQNLHHHHDNAKSNCEEGHFGQELWERGWLSETG